MKRFVTLSLAAAAVSAISVGALAASTPVRLRGTITAISADTLTLKTNSGKTEQVMIGGDTHFLKVEKSSLGMIDKNTYIGTATKTVGSQLIALEVVIFPNAMRGTGDGHYAWDKLPDTTLSGGTKTASTMTNGNVAAVSGGAAGGKVSSTMTNGNVAATKSSDGVKRLTVTYKGGQQTILVPPTAPIVKFAPGMKADAVTGAHVFIKASESDGKITAGAVAVGVDGVTPPM
ncbi:MULTISPECIES: hypothetical protein [Acidiphilium]|uniref:DUF5666 domain-containing protein n=1 Tax=Acidiphilium rubrum TaxID=526 RepID=A0A8G2FEJ8_ACIRU|nr:MULTISPECIES: hypothetical protein [Acidiphilium]MBW4035291.1 hypothetical protein [Pseudomonadota bacterium]SIR31822.1 hypothetical protein SAMN05421828_12432 [Acidiphilium rubrum]